MCFSVCVVKGMSSPIPIGETAPPAAQSVLLYASLAVALIIASVSGQSTTRRM
jgi:hypothetical protein